MPNERQYTVLYCRECNRLKKLKICIIQLSRNLTITNYIQTTQNNDITRFFTVEVKKLELGKEAL